MLLVRVRLCVRVLGLFLSLSPCPLVLDGMYTVVDNNA